MASVYTSNASALVDELEKTLDQHPAWVRLLKLFRGHLEEPGDDTLPVVIGGVAHLANGPEAIRRVGLIGRCACPVRCTKMPPLDCYTCEHFHISRDPERHRRQLVQLRQDLESQVGMVSERMQRMLVEPMLAIEEVVSKTAGRDLAKSLAAALTTQAVPSPFDVGPEEGSEEPQEV